MRGPRKELEERLTDRRARVARLERRDARVALGRLAAFGAAALLAALWRWGGLAPAFVLLPLLAFAALVALHDRVLRELCAARRAVTFHEEALARLAGRPPAAGPTGSAYAREDHPYALDLDLFGEGSLFHLLCTARTRSGEERLAAWLLSPAGAAEVVARQRAVQELAPLLDLREHLAVLGDEVRAAVDPAALSAWGRAAPALPRGAAAAALALATATAAGAVPWALGHGPAPFLVALALGLAFRLATRARVQRVLRDLDRPSAELRVLSLLLARLEREPFRDDRLGALQARLGAGGSAASQQISALGRIASRLEWGRNQLFAPLAFLLHWSALHATAVERWRSASGARLGDWLDAAAELEALCALGAYAHARPDHAFPAVAARAPGAPASFQADALRHPLLLGAVPNDVRLGGLGPAACLVSGSNMSGKSTFLRTVGVAVVLGQAGAPVPSARCAFTPLMPGATLRIQDSLLAGRSRFLAEVTRLRLLQDLAASGEPALLFLLDELLHGTNSHDRRIGAEAVLRTLVAAGAIGLATTHDLALTELAGAVGGLANAHFEDQLVDGRIAFDYRLRPGVVAHSNALALMRAVGLRV
ncbi:MAG TPA: DNA mismatch repair protein MutS [Anaeromyxobacter sp.]|nr:DNA mismatch repair protein MutS [Anaeromyxobacter sp.]